MRWNGLSKKVLQAEAKMWLLASLAAYLVFAAAIVWELNTSTLQSQIFTAINQFTDYQVETGPSPAIVYPTSGPYDERLGYTSLPSFAERLQTEGFSIRSQARSSWLLRNLMKLGIFAPYPEKSQSGLTLEGQAANPFYSFQFPRRQYTEFSQIPPLLVESIAFIENRQLLDTDSPTKNPAVEWKRFAKAVKDQVIAEFSDRHKVTGGSTIAVQIEKYRHSPHGVTISPLEKIRQITSASIKSYRQGPDTSQYRQQRLMDYLNSVPLAAYPRYGEVRGIGDGLWAWHDIPFDYANEILSMETATLDESALEAQARIYKKALSLLIAHRRPSYYLLKAPQQLRKLTDGYLEALANAGIISERLKDAAVQEDLMLCQTPKTKPESSFVTQKASTAVRIWLAGLLHSGNLYNLDRYDLSVDTTINQELQQNITDFLIHLEDNKFAQAQGLNFRRTSSQADPSDVIISFTLHEKGDKANYLRVQTDNNEQPFDINESAKLGLGSSAKMRVLVHYLNLIAELHKKYTGLSEMELMSLDIPKRDRLSRWVVEQLIAQQELTLQEILQKALDRRYSASIGERFFTAGGLHSFHNYSAAYNYAYLPVRKAFWHSVNLVFIRLMRDIVDYYIANNPQASPSIFDNPRDPKRQEYLARFADYEGKVYLKKFYRKYKNQVGLERLNALIKSIYPTPKRLAIIYRSIYPDASFATFSYFLKEHAVSAYLSDDTMRALYEEYGPDKFNLQDRGYLARIHPLELWLVAHLISHPDASLQEILDKSYEQRQAVYSWLFHTKHKRTQDNKIRILLERDAFKEIHREWVKLGYPFDSLVPSYGTAIGSSADRPSSLTELLGILVNDGMHYPRVAIKKLHFAQGTPFETVFERKVGEGERVMPVEVAQAVKQELQGVVEKGTARTLNGVFKELTGSPIDVGGKTGTGDNRYKTFSRGGHLVESKVVNRTATFAFIIDDRFFGTINLYVDGEEADKFKFTSSLPVHILAKLAPLLDPVVQKTAVSQRSTDNPAEEISF